MNTLSNSMMRLFIISGLLLCLPAQGACVWSALGEERISVVEREGRSEVVHTGWSDWTFVYDNVISVEPNDIVSVAAEIEPGRNPTRGHVSLCASLFDVRGRVVSWVFAPAVFRIPAAARETITHSFVVPEGISSISPRLTGVGEVCFGTRLLTCERKGVFKRKRVNDVTFCTGRLKVKVRGCDAGIEVIDTRIGRTWRTAKEMGGFVPLKAVPFSKGVKMTVVDLCSLTTNDVIVSSDASNSVKVELRGRGKMSRRIRYPYPFETEKGERLILPLREGIGYPVEENVSIPRSFGLSMPFFGVADDVDGAGWMGLLETPDDVSVVPSRVNGCLTAGVEWLSQKGKFGYARRIRFAFQERGGYVAMAKRYRKIAQKQGRLVTLADKRNLNPKIDVLVGAANVWYMYGSNAVDSVQLVKEMQSAGIEKILWSNGGDVKTLASMTNVLVSTYDVYQDVGHPDQERKLGRKVSNSEAWPNDIVWEGPSSNDWAYAWGIKAADGTWTHCAMMCDACAPRYARLKIATDIANRGPFNCRFIDTTTAASLRECWHPNHPMTRSDSRRSRVELLKVLGGEFGLVAGSEDGNDTVLPWCDYFEGMMSLNPYRVPDSGRDLLKVWTVPPADVEKYQVGEKYRLPLWELVYHDCCVAYWYWGDYSNKIPSLWRKRDLFNALYATPPMFLFDGRDWDRLKDRFVQSYKCGGTLAGATGYSEMLNHLCLTADRSVQRTDFANGISVVVNFGSSPFVMEGGKTVMPLSHTVIRKHRHLKK